MFGSAPFDINSPDNRVYPIVEAGIFNSHLKDIGIFDIVDQTYTANDANLLDAHNVDNRVGAAYASNTNSNSDTEFIFGTGTTPNLVTFNEETNVLTGQNQRVTVAKKGFTQGPITQSMLCRTTFDPVNKATADTLQITWSVQLEDAT